MLTFAQFERELTSERTKDKLYERAQKGLWNGGIVPFGYKKENKKLIIDETEAKIVKSIYESYLECHSVSQIYNDLKNKGITYRTGMPFSKSGVQNILRYVVYTGKVKYGDKVFIGIQEPLISEEMFNAVQEIHKKKKLTMKMYKGYHLAGLLKCQECGSFMTPCHTNKYKIGKKTRYYYYRCTKTFKRDWDSCNTRQVSADRLEDYIFQNLERISTDRQYIDSLIFTLNNTQAGNRIGFEPSPEPPKVSTEIFGQTLTLFVKGLRERKGIEKSLWAKKFIQGISYSKQNIIVNIRYFKDFIPPESHCQFNQNQMLEKKKEESIKPSSFSNSQFVSLTKTPQSVSFRTVDIILPNMIHGCKRKDI
jgi:hypothetical protein